MSTAAAPLRIPRFRAVWAATVFSATGTFIQTVAGSWLMFELTGSNTWVGLMVASATLPLLFLSPISGALADMFDRARIMVIAQSAMGLSAMAMALLSHLGRMTPGLLLLLGLLLGLGGALNLPAAQALLPDLVPRGMIASAVALQSAAFNTARAVGPAVGGFLVFAYGPALGFGINALSYLALIVVLMVIAPSLADRVRETASVFNATTIGIRFARFTPPFRNLLALVAVFGITSAVLQATLPVHTDYLGGSAGMFGLLLGAMGAGALIAVSLRTRLASLVNGSIVPYTISLFGVSGILLAIAPNLWVAGVAMVFAGVFWLLTLSTLNTTAQLIAPEWIRGRAMSLYTLAFAGITPLGAILSGMVADQVGTPWALVSFSVGSIALGQLTPRFGVPGLDEIRSPEFTHAESGPIHDDAPVEGGPVVVLNTWVIDQSDYSEFLRVMNQLRLVRLSTGAYRWRLMRNVSDPSRMTELFATHSWEEHLAQHRRIDDAAAEVIGRARGFDRDGGPVTRHLIAVDVADAIDSLDYEVMVATHEEMHRTDGSIPLDDPGP